MATNAKLWGTGGSAAEDVTKTNCGIIAGYPSVLTAQSNYLIRSVTASPAAQETVMLTATPSSPTTITFSSSGGVNLGTKILSFFVYAGGKQFSGADRYILYLCGDAATNGYLVSSVNPAVTSNTDAGAYVCWGSASAANSIRLLPSLSGNKNFTYDKVQLSYSGTNGNLTISIAYASGTGTVSAAGIFDENSTYTGVFRVVDES